MRCPSCQAETADPEAAYCARCGAPLTTSAADPTRRQRSRRAAGPFSNLPVRDLAVALRSSIATRGWLDASKAASVAFLALLAVGAVLLVAAKLQNPRLGTGSSPLSVLTAVVLLALASLGAPIRIGDVEIAALPLGALLAIGAALAWAASKVAGTAGVSDARAAALAGAKVGVPFALLAWAAALIFRFRTGTPPVAAGAGEVLVLSLLWGAGFGALGGLRAAGLLGALTTQPFRALKERSASLYLGVQAGGAMLLVAALGAVAAGLLWVIVALAKGSAPPGFDAGDALAALVYIAAFLPNVLVFLLTLSLGAPLEVGARVKLGGRALGPLQELSLADWGPGGTPWYLWLLVLIPLVACLLAGFAARRNINGSARLVEVVVAAALTFAVPLALVAAVADARLGAGLVRSRGYAHVAPDAAAVLALALLWAGGLGFAGWKVAEAQEGSDETAPTVEETP